MRILRQHFRFSLSILSTLLLAAPTASFAQCLSVAIAISHGVKTKRTKSVRAVVGAVLYEQRLDDGSVRMLPGSTIAFAEGTKNQTTSRGSGSSPTVNVQGDITTVPKKVEIEGQAVIDVEGRGPVSTSIKISASKLTRKVVARRNGQKITVLKGFTSYRVTDLSTGSILSKAKPSRFSKLRTFRYQWKTGLCSGSSGGGGKK